MSMSHVSLNVSDLDRTIEFWLAALRPLGFMRADGVPGDYCRITNCVDVVFTFGQVSSAESRATHDQSAVGLFHVALLAASKLQVDELASHLTRLGVELVGEGVTEMDYRGGYYSLAFRDPDNIEIEVAFHGAQYFAAGEAD